MVEGNLSSPRRLLVRLNVTSLGWVELRTTLAKLHYTYDLKLLDDKLDWHRDVRMHTLWQKPELKVQVLSRAKGIGDRKVDPGLVE